MKLIIAFYLSCSLFLVSCHSDSNIIINPIDLELDYAPVDKMKYYEISNFERLSNEDLLQTLEDYVRSNCSENEIKQYEYYTLSFYKKSVGVDYRQYILEKRKEQAEFPIIEEQKENNIALIYFRKLDERKDVWSYSRILYNNDSILLIKEDTISCRNNTNKQELKTPMNKNIPENTITVIHFEGEDIYLTDIHRVPVETTFYSPDSWYGKAKEHADNDDFLYVAFITENYPAEYREELYFVHIIPEGNKFRLRTWLSFYGFFENKKYVTDGEPIGLWEDVGYSTDNTLWAKIVEYYMSKK